MSDLRSAADHYRTLGWQLVPVQGKRPRLGWESPPTWHQVEKVIADSKTTGIAVILGAPSGDLVARDFDEPDAYERWKSEHPDLTKLLPIARTGRPEGGYHVYGTMVGAPLLKFADGELRGSGGPSRLK
jgi:hypothetical protein